MDRLICGDVGYGKTEVAIRAAFKAVDNGKQVAVLVPTTVLAEQHYRTLQPAAGRVSRSPSRPSAASARTAEQKRRPQAARRRAASTSSSARTGSFSKDVQFKDLGLVDHRRGAAVRRRAQGAAQAAAGDGRRADADGHADPADAAPVRCWASATSRTWRRRRRTAWRSRRASSASTTSSIRHAILRELNRDGQVYFVHNRVHDIHDDRRPRAGDRPRGADRHRPRADGRATSWKRRCSTFVRREADILVATTIIESGLDIPNANTIFINEADNYGLADLHQLRGRVGPLQAPGLLLPAARQPTGRSRRTRRKRLKAIEEFTELGAGFKIAMRDLEIRGAGNILGTEQTGHIAPSATSCTASCWRTPCGP